MSKYEPCYHKGEKEFMDTDLVLNNIRKWLNETNDEQTLIDTLDICLFFGKIENQEQEIKRLKEEYVMLQNASDEVEEEKDKEIERLNKDLKDACEVIERLKEDKKKAIEYIEENKRTYENGEYCFDDMIDDVMPLLEILKGSDKE